MDLPLIGKPHALQSPLDDGTDEFCGRENDLSCPGLASPVSSPGFLEPRISLGEPLGGDLLDASLGSREAGFSIGDTGEKGSWFGDGLGASLGRVNKRSSS